MANQNQDILHLFDRPREPVYFIKDDKTAFKAPESFFEGRFKPLAVKFESRFGETATQEIKVKDIPKPNLGLGTSLSRHENFSLFIPKHRKAAGALISLFINAPSVDDLRSLTVYARDKVNPYLFNYALSVTLTHRPDTKNLEIPSIVTTFPDKFIDGTVLQKAKEEASIVPKGSRIPIVIPRDYTATDLEPEHRIAYWREDIGINLHHWHWHLVYPFEGPDNVVGKDRRGELFYFMHQQIQARYNFERLCNKLARVERFQNWREPIEGAYFPKLDNLVAGRAYPARTANLVLQDLNREVDQAKVDVADMERWRDRIFAAIHSGSIQLPDGSTRQLGEFDGVDILGNIMESSSITLNRNFYGDLHNLLHVSLGLLHDPDGRHLETFGAVADPTTAMRDPLFFRLHEFVDDVFQEYKQTLPPYTGPQLNYQGVTVSNVVLDVEGSQPNILQTFWQQSDVEISRGLDFTPRGPVFVRFTHLQHSPFTYRITVNNSGPQRMGTCRIFLSPKFDERGTTWLLRDQRLMFVEQDRFTVTLKQGKNEIIRRSTESNLTIPYERTFRDVDTNRPPEGTDAALEFNFCGCGWPQHLLVPKGDPAGFPCDLFVMISNYEDDRIDQPAPTGRCSDAFTFCGLKDRLYPDKRPMGYPFDRFPAAGVDTIQQFLFPNMKLTDVQIKFTERTVIGNQPTRA